MDYMDRLDVSAPAGNRGLSMGFALFCAAAFGYVLGSDRVGPGKAGFVVMFAAMLLSNLQNLVGPRLLRRVVLPILSLVLLAISAVMLIRAHVL